MDKRTILNIIKNVFDEAQARRLPVICVYLEAIPRLLVSKYNVFVLVFLFVFLCGRCIVGADL